MTALAVVEDMWKRKKYLKKVLTKSRIFFHPHPWGQCIVMVLREPHGWSGTLQKGKVIAWCRFCTACCILQCHCWWKVSRWGFWLSWHIVMPACSLWRSFRKDFLMAGQMMTQEPLTSKSSSDVSLLYISKYLCTILGVCPYVAGHPLCVSL